MHAVTQTLFCVVYITAPSQQVAQQLAQGLVQQHWVACVSLLPQVQSVYWWQGRVCQDAEVLLMCKTQINKLEGVFEWVKQNHPYDTPEIIAVPILEGSKEYLDWLAESVQQ